MAALIRHGLLKGGQAINTYSNMVLIQTRNASKKVKPSFKMPYNRKKPYKPPGIHFDSTGDSIAAKGFHRAQKPYTPPEDVTERINSIYKSMVDTADSVLSTPEVKFNFLNACLQEFQHSVPNSLLSSMNTIDDVIEFYQTPVEKAAPIDTMKKMTLPENLHIQYEYHRFHPETDTMFNGVSAFPKSSTIVTGLRYEKKYKGYTAKGLKGTWPF
ncbi:hypothetical protein C0J52_14241 [Blattella germanica]|nr:hypothetical protein C0J52_14241 [Blattella germanica]